uniref:Thiaminase (Transcriptional activator TenA) n=1 Tax=Candidatus Kentrum sp. FM TaxID=2126340 RepID=A0A450S5B4_9GAMM|nr:MAG: thiaminase (transcriptional activator TenA) [Candidatus Kentron sp. FM]VFJ73203.1 MAG: thiaminase (transcriptional activator TenA) [Candidatus Kentron sp. FM]VFK08905.1 MAG: thiaminase (transcriptional activator TenA) [Candidatus Kentron sp. FM]
MKYGSTVFPLLRTQAGQIWDAYVRHEFVEKLRDGTLPRAAFLHYLRQDYLFLIHFARAWALAVFKSGRLDEMRVAAAMIDAHINEEMRLHIRTCAAEGMEEATLAATTEEPENLAYTRFVIDTGMKGDLLDLLVALLPCVLGYGEIGSRLGAETDGPPPEHPYREWIESYASPAYQAVCTDVGRLLENVSLVQYEMIL